MADKNIGSLPAATALDDDSLLIVEQQGEAVKLTGAQLKAYIQSVAAEAASAVLAQTSAE